METQQTIHEWGVATFGENTALSMVVRANLEMAELISAIQNGVDIDKVALEIADVDIVMCQAAAILGLDTPSIACMFPRDPTNREKAMFWVMQANSFMSAIILGLNGWGKNLDEPQLLFDDLYQALVMASNHLASDMQTRRDEKMQINRGRSWGRTEGGHFQHVEETDQS